MDRLAVNKTSCPCRKIRTLADGIARAAAEEFVAAKEQFVGVFMDYLPFARKYNHTDVFAGIPRPRRTAPKVKKICRSTKVRILKTVSCQQHQCIGMDYDINEQVHCPACLRWDRRFLNQAIASSNPLEARFNR